MISLYALTDARVVLPPGLRAVACESFLAIVADVEQVPVITEAALRDHDATVRALVTTCEAILPARFGSVVAAEPELVDALEARTAALLDALTLVKGMDQMTLRVFGAASLVEPIAKPVAADRSGTDYMIERQRALQTQTVVDEIARLRPLLAPLIHGERSERYAAPPLVGSVYHLVRRGQATAYETVVREAASVMDPIRVAVSGPWPPYAFAPEAIR